MTVINDNRYAMKEPIVSVIIPVYNTEKYIRETVENIRRQTLNALEIILIDDGSTDNSLAVMQELAAADERIRVRSHSNRGPSLTRNAGLAIASGQYIYFMDSDDLLDPDTLQQCYHVCENLRLDFVIFNADSFYDADVQTTVSLRYNHTTGMEDRVYTGLEAFETQLKNKVYTPSPCLSFIRRSFFDASGVHYYPGIIHEDQLFTTQLYLAAERVGWIDASFFHRRLRADSIMTRPFAWKNMEGYLTVAREIGAYVADQPDAVRRVIDVYLSQMLDAAVWQSHSLPLDERIRLCLICLRRYKRYVSNKTLVSLLLKKYLNPVK